MYEYDLTVKNLTLNSIEKHSEDNPKGILKLNQSHYHLDTHYVA